MPDTAIPTTPATPTSRHRATSWDRFAIVLLGIAGCALSYDALRQMATAVHVRPHLTYLFPVVIDGFIAYGVRALLVLREAPLPARLYAWTLFIAATAASIWANGLHALDLNQPGTVDLHLDDITVTVLSAIAPLALAGATHLHILITRYGGTDPAGTSVHPTTARVPYRHQQADGTLSADPSQQRKRLERHDLPQPQQAGIAQPGEATVPGALGSGSVDLDSGTGTVPPAGSPHSESEDEPDGADQGQDEGSVPRAQSQGGRPPMASLERLAEVITAAHPDPDAITRDSARKALSESGLGAGTVRLTEAITLVRRAAQAREHPDQRPLADRT
ncbi:DUF2637 domain-containing protein [Streptomyces sp. NBC_01485]|uniref:DUF2637 domain-containing protein n=1 Tax=Streptomyces sp. NBC_01485 TaxID=2903884 RepID=UPI002E2FEE13|nr:DUF2637 domain-containing protein [Streptomyces sp. NBC_01485]